MVTAFKRQHLPGAKLELERFSKKKVYRPIFLGGDVKKFADHIIMALDPAFLPSHLQPAHSSNHSCPRELTRIVV